MDYTNVTSYEVSKDLYAITTWGADGKMPFYYDQFGQLRSRFEILRNRKKVPPEYTPAYLLGFLIRQLSDDVEDMVALLCIENVKRGVIK